MDTDKKTMKDTMVCIRTFDFTVISNIAWRPICD